MKTKYVNVLCKVEYILIIIKQKKKKKDAYLRGGLSLYTKPAGTTFVFLTLLNSEK